jgi:hypothetical protein
LSTPHITEKIMTLTPTVLLRRCGGWLASTSDDCTLKVTVEGIEALLKVDPDAPEAGEKPEPDTK